MSDGKIHNEVKAIINRYLKINNFITDEKNGFTPPPIQKQSFVMSMSVCLCVCLSVCSHIFRNYTSDLPLNFLCMSPMVVARSFSGSVVIHYVILVFG